MILSDYSIEQICQRLAAEGLVLHLKPLVVTVRSSEPSVARSLAFHYGQYQLGEKRDVFSDFHIGVARPRGLRRWFQPQIHFSFDGEIPFKPLPLSQAYPVFEWGLNWCIASAYHRFVAVHAAVVERGGLAVLMPGEPGAGKSTLCAAMAHRGWRLFSDEMALLTPGSNQLTPIPRPVCLKNESIDVIRRFAPLAAIGEAFRDTRKGDVAHMRAPDEAVLRAEETASARWLVFPRYRAGADLEVVPVSKPEAVLRLADQCFNYAHLGGEAFHTLCAVVDGADCFSLNYSRLPEAIAFFDQLTGGRPA